MKRTDVEARRNLQPSHCQILLAFRSKYYKNKQNNVSNNNIGQFMDKDLEALIRIVYLRK